MSFSLSASPLLSVTLGPKIKGNLALDSTFFCLFTRFSSKISVLRLKGEKHACVHDFIRFDNFSPYFNVLTLQSNCVNCIYSQSNTFFF